jgi:uncharacterized protein (TIGR03437 family)
MKNSMRFALLLLSAVAAWAQSPTVYALGNPYPKITLSPGQVTTLSLTGAPTILPLDSNGGNPHITASVIPVPTSLAGFSASLSTQFELTAHSLPILSVYQMSICGPKPQTPDCVLTLLTVQIPSDVYLPPFPFGPFRPTTVGVLDHGVEVVNFTVSTQPVTVHILTRCDSIVGFPLNSIFCPPLITRPDGSLVGFFTGEPTPVSVQPGETLVIYATGLGVTQPAVPEGTASPTPAAVSVRHFTIVFNYNCGTIVTVTPNFVGLTPGQVGLYQVNFVAPQPAACTTTLQNNMINTGSLTLMSDDWASSDSVYLYRGANGKN